MSNYRLSKVKVFNIYRNVYPWIGGIFTFFVLVKFNADVTQILVGQRGFAITLIVTILGFVITVFSIVHALDNELMRVIKSLKDNYKRILRYGKVSFSTGGLLVFLILVHKLADFVPIDSFIDLKVLSMFILVLCISFLLLTYRFITVILFLVSAK